MSPNDLRLFLQFTMTGLSEGALLALIALGLVLIYKSTDVLNFAHGEFMLLGAFIAWDLLVNYHLPLLLALLITGAIMVAIAVAVERLMLRPLIGKPIILGHHGNHWHEQPNTRDCWSDLGAEATDTPADFP